MHGFFVDLRLYTKARAIANPFAYAEHRERLIAARLEKERESRIRGTVGRSKQPASDKVKVNQSLVDRIREREEKEKKREERRKAKQILDESAAAGEDEEEDGRVGGASSLLSDPRFSQVFNDPEFQVDETSREFALVNPSAYSQAMVSHAAPTLFPDTCRTASPLSQILTQNND
jgi:ribosome biogenesis protein ENP2